MKGFSRSLRRAAKNYKLHISKGGEILTDIFTPNTYYLLLLNYVILKISCRFEGGGASPLRKFPFAAMISGILIFNQKGEVLISRIYRQDLKRSIADVFRIHVLSSTDIRSPITTIGSTTFFHVKRENVYIVAVTKVNANAALVFEFLNHLVDGIGPSYFGKMDEEGIKSNFVLIYELLDGIFSSFFFFWGLKSFLLISV